MRELEEEMGLTELALRWGAERCETDPYARGEVARFYVAESAQSEVVVPINPRLGRLEHHEFRCVDFDAARRLLPPRRLPVLRWAQTLANEQ